MVIGFAVSFVPSLSVKYLISLALFINLNTASGQSLEEVYSNDSEYMEFFGDSIRFQLESNGGLIYLLRGNGIFRQDENYLYLTTDNYKGKGSYCSFNQTRSEPILHVYGADHEPLQGAYVAFKNDAKEVVAECTTDSLGQIKLSKIPGFESVEVKFIGHDTYEFIYRLSEPSDIQVYLAQFEVVENETLIFKIHHNSEYSLQLSMLYSQPNLQGQFSNQNFKRHTHSANSDQVRKHNLTKN